MIGSLGVGPVDLFGSSGGAVNSLALVARHPEQVGTLVAHEPPLASVLPDREPLFAACADIYDTYASAGMGPAMAKFIALVQHKGELPTTYAAQPAPDPAAFGLPTEDDGSRDDPMLGQSILAPSRSTSPTSARLAARRPGSSSLPVWSPRGHGRPRSRGVR